MFEDGMLRACWTYSDALISAASSGGMLRMLDLKRLAVATATTEGIGGIGRIYVGFETSAGCHLVVTHVG
jgi:hypothetical protein